jgi:hypothetical protein
LRVSGEVAAGHSLDHDFGRRRITMVPPVPGVDEMLLVIGIALLVAAVATALLGWAFAAYEHRGAASDAPSPNVPRPSAPSPNVPRTVPLHWAREHARALRH